MLLVLKGLFPHWPFFYWSPFTRGVAGTENPLIASLVSSLISCSITLYVALVLTGGFKDKEHEAQSMVTAGENLDKSQKKLIEVVEAYCDSLRNKFLDEKGDVSFAQYGKLLNYSDEKISEILLEKPKIRKSDAMDLLLRRIGDLDRKYNLCLTAQTEGKSRKFVFPPALKTGIGNLNSLVGQLIEMDPDTIDRASISAVLGSFYSEQEQMEKIIQSVFLKSKQYRWKLEGSFIDKVTFPYRAYKKGKEALLSGS